MKRTRAILVAICVGLVTLELARPLDHGVPGVTVILAGAGTAALVGVAKILAEWLRRPVADDD